MNHPPDPKIVIAGCGYVGSRLAEAVKGRAEIECLVRSKKRLQHCHDLGFKAYRLDLDHPQHLRLDLAKSTVFYLVPPPGRGQIDLRLRHFLEAIDGSALPDRIVYLGTTGVYGNCQGAWVDESRTPAPTADRAKRRLDAEQQLLRWQQQTGKALVRLRVSGIYGPGKLPLDRLRQQKPMIAADQAPWTNRIHADDLVQACIAAMLKGKNGAIYNLSDGQPGKMTDYFNRVADYARLPRPPIIPPEQAGSELTPGMRSYLAESRRIDNRLMREELGVKLKYPDLESGLAAIFSIPGQSALGRSRDLP